MPNNCISVAAQLRSLEKRLEKDKDLKKRYQETINVDLEKGFVRKIDNYGLKKARNKQQWYLPHHPVINHNKPEKVCRVCNAKLNLMGVSLNDMLLSGPDLVQNLIGIIFRFGEHSTAMTADVEAMFLQVLVPSDD